MAEKYSHTVNRRDFLYLSSLSLLGVATGCAVNPVTGKTQLMLMSDEQEIQIDREHSPHQFSSDFGVTQDKELNAYIQSVGNPLAAAGHRGEMPYSFQVVNATYVNAYAFPGGTIAASRGILLKLDNEAELAGLLGHEIGHVASRHTAQRMSKAMLASTVVAGLAIAVAATNEQYAPLAASLGMVGVGALLAKYSRDQEREADALGLEYAYRTGYDPEGYVGLMDMLNTMNKSKSSAAGVLFSTHPMSSERYETAVTAANRDYARSSQMRIARERYMDHTARLRTLEPAIVAMQKGDEALTQKKTEEASSHYRQALVQAPRDYTANVKMAVCLLEMKQPEEARKYAAAANNLFPEEAQAYHVGGIALLQQKKFDQANERFTTYQRILPGNPNTIFFKGYSLEGMGQRRPAAEQYNSYLQQVSQGEMVAYARQRLVEWGYLSR